MTRDPTPPGTIPAFILERSGAAEAEVALALAAAPEHSEMCLNLSALTLVLRRRHLHLSLRLAETFHPECVLLKSTPRARSRPQALALTCT